MTKFTPGPWRGNELNKGEALIVEPCDTSLPPICLVDRQPNAWDNANLIAAAPRLYNAAKKALEECCDLISTPAGIALLEAIEQAEGKQL